MAGTPVYINYTAHGAPGNVSRNNCCDASYLGYDGVQRLASLAHYFAGSGNEVIYSYSRDAAGGLTSVTRTNDTYAWTGHANANDSYTRTG